IEVAPFIHVVEKGESNGKKQHADSSKQADADHRPKFIRTRWAYWWTTSHSRENVGSVRCKIEPSTPNGTRELNGSPIGTALCPPFGARLGNQGREFGIKDHDV